MPQGFWQRNGPWVDANVQRFSKALKSNDEEFDNSWSATTLDVNAVAKLEATTGYLQGPLQPSKGARVYLVFDTSGSMSGNHIEDGCAICAVLNILARKRVIDFDFVATGYSGMKSRMTNTWWNETIPLEDWCWESIDAWHGTEGISSSMIKTKDALFKADLAFAYTDACICDAQLNPSLWQERGLSVTGLYSGNVKQERAMKGYFDDVIARRTKDELAEAMIHLIRAKQG